MPLEKKYDETPLQVLTTKQTRARIKRLKDHTGLSQAAIVREILEIGIPMFEELAGLGRGIDES